MKGAILVNTGKKSDFVIFRAYELLLIFDRDFVITIPLEIERTVFVTCEVEERFL